jgi:pyruvate dehydrogenase E2 component (dihydrolipoamide acetyltransferase)
MVTKVIVPQKGLSDETCLIQEWKKKEGDRVEKGEMICEVETNKAVFEIDAPVSGVLLKIIHQEGEEIPVMEPIAIIGEPGEEFQHLLEEKETAETEKSRESIVTRQTVFQDKQKVKQPSEKSIEVKISPRAHRIAQESNLDISHIKGSGPEGRIIERDIQAILDHEKFTEATGKASDISQEIPVKGIRRMIAERMFHSLQSTAQLTLHSSFQAKKLLEYRRQLKESSEKSSYRDININHLIMFGVIKALKKFSEINSHYQDGRIIQFKSIHLGFAVDTEEGLKVPVVHQAEQYSLAQFSRKMQQLTRQCLDRTIKINDLEGGTFTVTNLGSLGIEYFTPILNLPQTGILGIGCQQIRPVIKANSFEFMPFIGLSLTFDHRAIDGAPAARFLQQTIMVLEDFNLKPHQKP